MFLECVSHRCHLTFDDALIPVPDEDDPEGVPVAEPRDVAEAAVAVRAQALRPRGGEAVRLGGEGGAIVEQQATLCG